MDEARRDELFDRWNRETGDPETREWRDGLMPDELEYVEQLDGDYNIGFRRICIHILLREKIRQRYSPAEIREVEFAGEHCRLWLRDGSMYLARLARDGSLRLDPIDTTC